MEKQSSSYKPWVPSLCPDHTPSQEDHDASSVKTTQSPSHALVRNIAMSALLKFSQGTSKIQPKDQGRVVPKDSAPNRVSETSAQTKESKLGALRDLDYDVKRSGSSSGTKDPASGLQQDQFPDTIPCHPSPDVKPSLTPDVSAFVELGTSQEGKLGNSLKHSPIKGDRVLAKQSLSDSKIPQKKIRDTSNDPLPRLMCRERVPGAAEEELRKANGLPPRSSKQKRSLRKKIKKKAVKRGMTLEQYEHFLTQQTKYRNLTWRK